jgi:hypothetical protein
MSQHLPADRAAVCGRQQDQKARLDPVDADEGAAAIFTGRRKDRARAEHQPRIPERRFGLERRVAFVLSPSLAEIFEQQLQPPAAAGATVGPQSLSARQEHRDSTQSQERNMNIRCAPQRPYAPQSLCR